MKHEASITIVLGVLWLLLLGSLGMVVSTFIHGSQVFELISFHFASTEISWTFLFDTLSAPIFAMVASL